MSKLLNPVYTCLYSLKSSVPSLVSLRYYLRKEKNSIVFPLKATPPDPEASTLSAPEDYYILVGFHLGQCLRR